MSALPPALRDGTDFSTRTLFSSPSLSAHATEVRGSLAAHYHENHEESVYITSGSARLRIGNEWFDLVVGDLIHIPRGVVHEVEVDASVSVISFFAPPYRGVDRILVPSHSTKEEGEQKPSSKLPLEFAQGQSNPRSDFVFLSNWPQDRQRGQDRDS